jgi:hypothetical protein
VIARPRVVVVEGSLKADVAAALSGRSIIGLPGCIVNAECIATLQALGAEEALLALDADATSNSKVAQAQIDGLRLLKRSGFDEGIVRWRPELGKGLDDMLLTITRRASP